MAVSGFNSVPLGVARTGAAVVLGTDNTALGILQSGQRARELRAQRDAAARLKADQLRGKEFADAVKFKTDGSHYFGGALQEQVYAPLVGKLSANYRADSGLDEFGRIAANRPHLQQADSETAQSTAKTKYLDDFVGKAQADKALYNVQNLTTGISAGLRKDGRDLLPSEVDEEALTQAALADPNNYNEAEVVKRTAKDLFPTVSQKIAEAGNIGGQHYADQVKGRLVAFDGQGKPRLNADGTPVLNLTKDSEQLVDQGLFKMQVNKREKAYNALREKDPNLPQMTRRGHIATMLGPLAYYDQSHDEGLNTQPRVGRPAAGSGASVIPFNEKDVRPSDVGAAVKGAPHAFEQALGIEQFTPVQQGFYTSRRAGSPTIPQKNGTRKPVEMAALTSRRVVQEDASGKLSVDKNNTKPLSGTYGEPHQIPVNPRTGEEAFPKNKAEEEKLYREGYVPTTYVAVYTDKNENFTADYKRALQQAIEINDRKKEKDQESDADLEAKARDKASKGVSRKLVPYNDETQATVNNQAGAYYRDFDAGTRARRTPTKLPARPSFLKAKSGTTNTANPTTTTDRTGGMM